MIPRSRTPLAVTASLTILLAASCTTAQALRCDSALAARPPRNFGVVLDANGKETAIYRGGQPAACDELSYLQSLGVKSILKLNDRHLPIDADEQRQAAAMGIHVRSYPFNAATIGTSATCPSVQDALAFLQQPENQPVFVHCTGGKDRTGYIIGLYEKLVLGKPVAEVLDELHRYGHRGIRSFLMGQIDSELASSTPTCSR